jgi:cytochrome c oxidase subunit I
MSQIVEAGVAPELAASEQVGLLRWISSVDHKEIGILYFISAMFFFLIGGVEALVIRLQLLAPNLHLISPETFDQMFTMHGTTMIFLFVMPMLTGFSTYMVPLMIGARDMAFPRLNAMSFWIQLFGGVILYFSFLAGGASSAGWFAYTPLSEKAYSSLPGVDYWILGIACVGIGTLAGAINFAVTIICLRVEGLSIRRLPLFVWMTLVNSFLMIGALPLINAALAMLLIDRLFNAHVFDPAGGGDAILWQHYFWSFGHPEVYIMILPAFGIISEVIPVFSRKPIFGYEFVAASSVAIAFLSFTVWAHHMFTVGMSDVANLAFGVASMLIAVPTGIKIFNWTATMYGGRLWFTTAMMFAVAFLITFTIGGLSGISFAIFPLDWQLTDTYYLVAHFHYVLFGGSVFGIFAGAYYWFPKVTGRMLSERIGVWNFWLTFIGFNMTFLIQHVLGLAGMPRRVFTYPDLPGWAAMNMISTIGAFILGFSVLLFLWNVFDSVANGEVAGDNPWEAWTLEWATTSPPPPQNFDRVPPVRGRRPLWDLAHPDRTDEMAGQA